MVEYARYFKYPENTKTVAVASHLTEGSEIFF